MNPIFNLFEYKENANVCGLTKELNILYIVNYFRKNDKNVIVLTTSMYEANNFYKDLLTYEPECQLFPMDDFLTSMAIAVSPDFRIKRLETLEKLKKEQNNKHILVTHLNGYLKYLPNKNEETSIKVSTDSKIISREIILDKLETYGYKRESLVTTTGEYAVRGYIIDVFPMGQNKPIRIEFFDNEIEKIKEFDETTQLTTKLIDEIEIKKINEITSLESNSLLDYMPNNAVFLIDENQINNAYQNLTNEIFEYNVNKNLDPNTKYMFDYREMRPDSTYKIDTVNTYNDDNSLTYHSKELTNFNSNLQNLRDYCYKERRLKTVIIALHNHKQIKELQEEMKEAYLTNVDNIYNNAINIVEYQMNKGFIFDNYIVITPYDIDNIKTKEIKYRSSIKIGRKIKSFSDLEIGDYIVHEVHGIGIYNGLKTLKNSGYEKDYIELLYFGNDKVYIPVEKIDRIYKYSAKEGTKPKLNKLNSTAWAKKKLETRNKIKDISNELLELYSKRNKIKTTPYKDFEEEIMFALNFPYTLTSDQEKTINEISMDLKKDVPMDRLLCGDVGYGKTEVAFRAMFKTVINNFQVAYLCPTTLLSKQQYDNAIQRFKDFPIRIELLNRYVASSKTQKILKDLEEGKIDIIIGTHKLLNSKIKYKNLGLLVVDEEQRFGVTHKEKIKEIKNDVNVLTLSATPIPRTLKMAISGLRSLSILDTPPINRYPIQTYVIEENDLLIKDAIYKEMARAGQTYILINDINEMNSLVEKINKLVPEARTICAHGKMSSSEINSIMEDFIEGQYDILICTTIIETGIDIANVNTIIILDSDNFGLSQLYQIRGRVGRSDKIAYAYLMYKPSKVLTETATKRLNSIKEFTELGSGYKIAIRDLSIRGAGDLLGSEQAGFIDAVGIDIYTKMVNEEIQKIKGEYVEEENNDDNQSSLLNINTHIDDEYTDDDNIKIEIHKLINTIESEIDLETVKSELEDRFGHLNENMEVYMLEKCLEKKLEKLNIENILQTRDRINIALPQNISDQIDGEKLFLSVYSINPKFQLSYKNKEINISLPLHNLTKNYIYYLYDLINIIYNEIN